MFVRPIGVFFRKYTKAEAAKLKLTGWVRNTPEGTVRGVCEGPPAALARMYAPSSGPPIGRRRPLTGLCIVRAGKSG